MSEIWRQVAEHLPFVAAATGAPVPQVKLRDIVGAIVVGMVSAAGSTYVTTIKLEEKFNSLKETTTRIELKLDGTVQEISNNRSRIIKNESDIQHEHDRNNDRDFERSRQRERDNAHRPRF